ncbi:DNA methyltransferase [Desulfobacterales bacterium HSG2]|nr:DNA methyltransferase [Desulfobacterales bacterium HSG2]
MKNEQLKFDFDPRFSEVPIHSVLKPNAYKGLAGFHKYWGKKPTECWNFLITQLTRENELVIDPFLGSGLITREAADLKRRFIGIDINPFSVELTKLFMELPQANEYKKALAALRDEVKHEIDACYMLSDGRIASHYLWEGDSLKLIWCKPCNGRKKEELPPSEFDVELFQKHSRYQPENMRALSFFDNSRINTSKNLTINDLFTGRALRNIDSILYSVKKHSDILLRRALSLTLTASLGQMSNMVFAVTHRGKTSGRNSGKTEVGSWVIGYWRPKLHFEINVWNCFENKAKKLIKAISELNGSTSVRYSENVSDVFNTDVKIALSEGDAKSVFAQLPDSCARLILTDPPHGDRIPYLELSEMWNSVLGKPVDFEQEIVISNAKERGKTTENYNESISEFLVECGRVMTNDGCLAIIFNAKKKDHWNSLESIEKITPGLRYAGCFPMNYSAGSVVQDNRKGGLKQDYILLFCKTDSEKKISEIRRKFSSLPNWKDGSSLQ